MTDKETLKKAFKQAFQLGQDYWYQADHEYVSQNKKSDVTKARFEHLMEDAIKEALAQPQQEPVAWMFQHEETGRMNYVSNDGIHDPTMFLGMNPRYALVCPLYATPPQRKPLEDEEICPWFQKNTALTNEAAMRIVRAIEAAHGIKE